MYILKITLLHYHFYYTLLLTISIYYCYIYTNVSDLFVPQCIITGNVEQNKKKRLKNYNSNSPHWDLQSVILQAITPLLLNTCSCIIINTPNDIYIYDIYDM